MSHIETVAVVAADPIVRAGLTRMLTASPGLTVRHELADLAELAALRAVSPPSLVVLDLYDRTPSEPWHQLRVVALVRPQNPPDLPAVLRGGAIGLITRRGVAGDLPLAVEAVRRGGAYVAAELLATLPAPAQEPRLTEREVETLRWVAQGLTHSQIGRRMGLTESTVNTYVKRIRAKLQAGNKAELTRRAIELGLQGRPSHH
ncbi:response regulator transcription factor [Paractinoplanes atraurantiacus]|uniref:DNA-binding response regulator, NarL/FixJ family, contains REC and HTH domains n=1 Tax=Paractinoplanes atraurantiacus TaxID=1036182 RepID=A0A285JWE4_9ACTN|nr:response regulator transcription factor [Actinoplanes atraurantiacus]SNY64635.1 DNA-binding response regulator, NarL/FixJ family, contains REC and HTH domains [Actinoplanes atraurantiacus]